MATRLEATAGKDETAALAGYADGKVVVLGKREMRTSIPPLTFELLPNLEVVDNVRIPKGLAPGRYVLQWRWDCEESDQVWASCSDVTVE